MGLSSNEIKDLEALEDVAQLIKFLKDPLKYEALCVRAEVAVQDMKDVLQAKATVEAAEKYLASAKVIQKEADTQMKLNIEAFKQRVQSKEQTLSAEEDRLSMRSQDLDAREFSVKTIEDLNATAYEDIRSRKAELSKREIEVATREEEVRLAELDLQNRINKLERAIG